MHRRITLLSLIVLDLWCFKQTRNLVCCPLCILFMTAVVPPRHSLPFQPSLGLQSRFHQIHIYVTQRLFYEWTVESAENIAIASDGLYE